MDDSKNRGHSGKREAPQPLATGVSTEVNPGKGASGSESHIFFRRPKKICGCICIPFVLLVVLELILRVTGYGYSTSFFVPAGDGRTLAVNHRYGWQFFPRETATAPFPCFMSARKPEKTIRIFVLGESAALGTPDPAFGFSRILDVMLKRQYPERRFEIVNAAMWGINSHVILPIARECAGHDPDLFIIYMGNNEVVGLHAPEAGIFNLTPYLKVLRLAQRFKATKIGQLSEAIRRKAGGSEGECQDMEFFRKRRLASDDPLRRAVRDNFEDNLADILKATGRSGAKTILCTVAVNLKDCPPLASLHRRDLSPADEAAWNRLYENGISAEAAGLYDKASVLFLEAAKLDDRFADLQYRLARCFFAGGQFEKAAVHYKLACDSDALQFRSLRDFNV